tara:strand:- start:925 stop:1377 length:453 start_codon:yes stop_codon:yes gene_type:complete
MKGLAKRNNKTRGKTTRKRKNNRKTIRRRKMHGGVPQKNSLENKATKATKATKEQSKQYAIQLAEAMNKMTAEGHRYNGPSDSPGMYQPQGADDAQFLVKGPVEDNSDNLFKDMEKEGDADSDDENFNQQKEDMGFAIGGKKRKTHKKRK